MYGAQSLRFTGMQAMIPMTPLHRNVTPAGLFLTLLLSCAVWNMRMMMPTFSTFIHSWRHVEQLGDLGKAFRRVSWEKRNMLGCFHRPCGTQLGSAVDLPLCLARYLPRTMIRHRVTKTTTATTPPIRAWSVPCCPRALGSAERRRESVCVCGGVL